MGIIRYSIDCGRIPKFIFWWSWQRCINLGVAHGPTFSPISVRKHHPPFILWRIQHIILPASLPKLHPSPKSSFPQPLFSSPSLLSQTKACLGILPQHGCLCSASKHVGICTCHRLKGKTQSSNVGKLRCYVHFDQPPFPLT